MIKKLALGFCTFALAVASAATYHVTLYQPSMINGSELQPGDYKLEVDGDKATFKQGKKTAEAPVKIVEADKKYGSTSFKYDNGSDGKYRLQEICVGGSKTRLVFAN